MDKKEWEGRYKTKTIDQEPDAATLLLENKHLLSVGTALDIAMGMGQNAVFLASHGYKVTGIDLSSSAVSLAQEHAKKKAVSLRTVKSDILTCDIRENYFDVILNFYFLERSLIPGIKKGLKKNGLVFFETYTADQSHFGRPWNPNHLLKKNELLTFFLDFFIIFYHERVEEKKAIVSLIAQKV